MRTTPVLTVFLCGLVPGLAPGQITVGTIPPPGILCANGQAELPYTAVGTFTAGNTFTAELSDVNGSFATPTVLGSVVSTTSGTITCIFPAGLSGNGFQLRVNSSDPPEIGVPTAGLVMEAPDAGLSATASICGTSVNALPLLNGTPEPGGVWTVLLGTGTIAGGDQLSGVSDGSVYEYTVSSAGGCVSVSQLQINTEVPPNAGTNGSVTLCANSAPIDMFDLLGGTPDPGGVWTGPSPPIGGQFDPATMSSGVYGYHVAGMAPCSTASSYVFVSAIAVPDAGTSASLAVCSSDASFNMLPLLGGTPDLGGSWTSPGGAPQPPTFTPGVSLPGCYTYTVPGIPPCPNAASALCITVDQPANAGANATVNWCLSYGNVDLFSQLGGTPMVGGTWTDINGTGQLTGGTLTVAGLPGGTYAFTYTLDGGACADDQATVTVNMSPACIVSPQAPYPVE